MSFQRGNANGISSISFSPDGQYLFAAAALSVVQGDYGATKENSTVVWDVASGLEVRRFDGIEPHVSPDGTRVVTSQYNQVVAHDLQTGRDLATIKHCAHGRFLSDDEILCVRGDTHAYVYDAVSGKERWQFTDNDGRGDFNVVVVQGAKYVGISRNGWRGPTYVYTRKGKLIGSVPVQCAFNDCDIDPVTNRLAGFVKDQNPREPWGDSGHVVIFDLENRMAVGEEMPASALMSLSFGQKGKQLVTGSIKTEAILWDLASRRPIRTYPNQQRVAFSNDGRYLAFGVPEHASHDSSVYIHDAATGSRLKSLGGLIANVTALAAASRGAVIATGDANGGVRVWDLARARVLSAFVAHSSASALDHPILGLNFNAEGTLLNVCPYGGVGTVWNVPTGAKVEGRRGQCEGVNSKPVTTGDGRFEARLSPEGVQLFRAQTLVASVVGAGLADGVVVFPDGYYTATKGALRGVAFRIGRRAYPFEQFDLQFNRPDIVAERLGYADPATIASLRAAYEKRVRRTGVEQKPPGADTQVPELAVLKRPSYLSTEPVARFLLSATSATPLGHLLVFADDVPLEGANGRALPGALQWQGEVTVPLLAGENKIQLAVVDKSGLQSLRETVRVNYQTTAPPKPDLYVLGIGVSKLKDAERNLEFAAKDAHDLVQALGRQSQRFGKVFTRELLDEQATRGAILGVKDWLATAKVQDEIIVFVAGHGLVDDKLDYYFATHDIDFDAPARNGLGYDELESLLDGVAARRKLLLMDTCFSGEIDKDEVVASAEQQVAGGKLKTRAVSTRGLKLKGGRKLDAIAELLSESFADLRRGSGAVVISSAGGAEFALESAQWNNGVFTYSVLRGLESAGKDGTLKVSELRDYVVKQVRELTGGKQTPTMRRESLDNDFPVF